MGGQPTQQQPAAQGTQQPMAPAPVAQTRSDIRANQARASQPPADRMPSTGTGHVNGNRTNGSSNGTGQWDRQGEGQQPAARLDPARPPATGPLPAPGPLGGAGVAVPARGQRNGRPPGTGRVPRGRPGAAPARGAQPPQGHNPSPRTGRPGEPDAAIANRLVPGTDSGLPAPAGPVASRPGMMPVGRPTATALSVPVQPPVAQPPMQSQPLSPQPMQSQPMPLAPAPQVDPRRQAQERQAQERQLQEQSATTSMRRPPVAPPSAVVPPVAVGPPTALAPPVEKPAALAGPERREDIDPSCLTSEMEPISEVVEQKRKVDATLARFSAVHDEMAEEERARRSRRIKMMPWLGKDEDMEEALAPNGPAPAGSTIVAEPVAEPEEARTQAKPKLPTPVSRLQSKLAHKHGRNMTSIKIAAGAAAVLILAVSFFGWRAKSDATSTPIQEVAALDENSPAILESQKQYGDANFLVMGTDSRPGEGKPVGQATDTIMVVHIPVDGSRVAVVSFPPNLEVNRPACQQWNNQSNKSGAPVPAQTSVKLNSVYAVGGPRCVTDTVQQLTGLRINHFVGLDYSGFQDMVDSLQGVKLCVKAPLKDAALGTIVGQAGQVTLTGQQALNFVRAGQIVGDENLADYDRIDRQQRFLAALLRQAIGQQNLLMSANMLNNFLGTFTRSTFGDNMGVDQLSKLAMSLQGLSLGRITFVTMPTTNKLNAAGDETAQTTQGKQLFNAIIDNSPLPGETASAGGATQATAPATPQDTKVQVINGIGSGAGGDGAGSQTRTALTNLGYTVNQVSDSATTVSQTVIKYSVGQQAQAHLLASSVPSATLQVDPSLDGAIQLVLGKGFDHKVQAPHAGGSAGAASTSSSEAPAGLSYLNATDQTCAE
jgi:LCP family protein required for cell wall assembly